MPPFRPNARETHAYATPQPHRFLLRRQGIGATHQCHFLHRLRYLQTLTKRCHAALRHGMTPGGWHTSQPHISSRCRHGMATPAPCATSSGRHTMTPLLYPSSAIFSTVTPICSCSGETMPQRCAPIHTLPSWHWRTVSKSIANESEPPAHTSGHALGCHPFHWSWCSPTPYATDAQSVR